MEERREMNGQRVMTRDELEMRLPALNHIAEQRDAKFRLRYAEKTVNNGIERGYTLDAGTRVSVNVYQNESWVQMPDEELFDTLNDLDGRYCVTEDQETIGERLNALFKSGELFEKIYPVVFLPSSISEVIAVPQTAGEPETLLAMVHEINEMEVALEERLTDSIYPMCLADGEYRLSVIRPK